MTITLRIILIICSVISFILCVRKIKKSELKIENSIILFLGSILLILMSIFPGAVSWVSKLLGFESSVNFVWMAAIGFLLLEIFLDNIRISDLNEKVKNFNHYIALKENEQKQDGKEN